MFGLIIGVQVQEIYVRRELSSSLYTESIESGYLYPLARSFEHEWEVEGEDRL